MKAIMAPSKIVVALLLAFALLAGSLQPSLAIRAQLASTPTAAAAASDDQEAPEKAAATAAASTDAADAAAQPLPWPRLPGFPGAPPAGQLPGFPFPLFPFPLFPLPGAPPAGQLPGFPFPLFPPLFPLPGAPPAGQAPGFPFPLFPPLFPLPGAPPAGQLPGFPFPLFPLPSIPGFPPIHTSPGSPPASPPPAPSSPAGSPSSSPAAVTSSPSPPAQPTECMTPLMGLTPCMDYLTNAGGVQAPPSTCCDGFRALVRDAPICLCHGLNGDINRIMPAPMDFMRMMSLPATCGVALPLQALSQCSTGPVPPLKAAPSPAAAPSPMHRRKSKRIISEAKVHSTRYFQQ
ncbi:hypothetical protein ACP70R_039226 [Stipagrostis hirtigluma subsp. patula]